MASFFVDMGFNEAENYILRSQPYRKTLKAFSIRLLAQLSPVFVLAIVLFGVQTYSIHLIWIPFIPIVLPFLVGSNNGFHFLAIHPIHRILLATANFAPWRYGAFLNFASERAILVRRGQAFRFSHRELQRYLAAKASDPYWLLVFQRERERDESQALSRVE